MPNSPRRRKRSKRPRQTKMILTNCAACAAPLAHDHKKRCSRCKTTALLADIEHSMSHEALLQLPIG